MRAELAAAEDNTPVNQLCGKVEAAARFGLRMRAVNAE
jgi:hypothetical protein